LTASDEEGPSRERISRERVMGRELVDGHRRGKAESRAYISVERAMGRQRRDQWTAIDEDGVILLNFHTPCTFTLRRAKERSTALGHRRKVR
jgi:hypothetical protein